jgi:hypothetical protein
MKHLLVIVAIALVLIGGVTTALVAAPTWHPQGVPGISGPQAVLNQGASNNWSGYVVATSLNAPESQTVSDVAGQWTVPAVSSTGGSAFSAVWVGIGGFKNTTLVQIGTSQDFVQGSPQYAAWWELGPDPSNPIDMTINPGDTVRGEVKFNGGSEYVLTLTDLTTGANFSTTQSADAQRESAEWIVEAPSSDSQVLPIANFGSVSFSGATTTLNGRSGSIGDGAWQNGSVTMVNPGGTATPSGLSGDGGGFSVSWSASRGMSIFPSYPLGPRMGSLPWLTGHPR